MDQLDMVSLFNSQWLCKCGISKVSQMDFTIPVLIMSWGPKTAAIPIVDKLQTMEKGKFLDQTFLGKDEGASRHRFKFDIVPFKRLEDRKLFFS